MRLYKAYVINRATADILNEVTLIGRDKEDAALGLALTEDQKALKTDDDLEIIWQEVGAFEKREVQRIKTVE